MSEVVRLGAVARIDPEAEAELRALERGERIVEGPDELAEWLRDYENGTQLVVRLDLFADLIEGDHAERIESIRVPGCWFRAGDTAANVQHAAEMTRLNLERLRDDLTERGIDVALETLESLPPAVSIDAELESALASGAGRPRQPPRLQPQPGP